MRKLLFIFVVLFFTFPVSAQEAITNFHSDIYVQENGSVIVKETITVNRQGFKIKRGIYRDLPKTKGVTYAVRSVKRDGNTEPYFTENIGRFYRINTGDDHYLPHNGLFTFQIIYQANNVILGFPDYDEIYWNVTGNEWDFPIERASAKVFLPKGAKIRQQAGYVGSYGSRTPAADKGAGEFVTTKPLSDDEGLTIAVGFDKGFVSMTRPPSIPLERYTQYAFLILGVYLFVTWHLFGRDPAKEAVMPRFRGLPDLTPAQAGWIYAYGHNKADCLTAALLQSGVSGFLKMEGKNDIRISKMRPAQNGEEKLLDHHLRMPVTLTKKYDPLLKSFMDTFTTFLKNKAGEKYFTANTQWMVIGCLLMLALTTGLCYVAEALPFALVMGFYLIFFVPAGKGLISCFSTGKFSFSSLFVLIIIGLHFGTMSFGILAENPEMKIVFLFYITSLFALLVYSFLIIRPTYKGMQVIAHLDGIKMFLKAVEPTLPKEVDFQKMEALLPYAVLFGMEKEWDEKMKIVTAGTTYRPDWYGGHHFSSRSLDAFHSVVSTSCTPPSRSGSGGGGFSGGGFGGGGGGGR